MEASGAWEALEASEAYEASEDRSWEAEDCAVAVAVPLRKHVRPADHLLNRARTSKGVSTAGASTFNRETSNSGSVCFSLARASSFALVTSS